MGSTDTEIPQRISRLGHNLAVDQVAFTELRESARAAAHRSRRTSRFLVASGAAAAVLAAIPLSVAVIQPESSPQVTSAPSPQPGDPMPLHSAIDEPDPSWEESTHDFRQSLLRAAMAESIFTGAKISAPLGELVIYASGPPSPTIKGLADRAPADTTITWVQVPFTEAQLNAAQATLLSLPNVRSVQFGDDFASLVVGIDGSENDLPGTLQQANELVTVPVRVEIAPESGPLASTIR